jgi:hypothetical protein
MTSGCSRSCNLYSKLKLLVFFIFFIVIWGEVSMCEYLPHNNSPFVDLHTKQVLSRYTALDTMESTLHAVVPLCVWRGFSSYTRVRWSKRRCQSESLRSNGAPKRPLSTPCQSAGRGRSVAPNWSEQREPGRPKQNRHVGVSHRHIKSILKKISLDVFAMIIA